MQVVRQFFGDIVMNRQIPASPIQGLRVAQICYPGEEPAGARSSTLGSAALPLRGKTIYQRNGKIKEPGYEIWQRAVSRFQRLGLFSLSLTRIKIVGTAGRPSAVIPVLPL